MSIAFRLNFLSILTVRYGGCITTDGNPPVDLLLHLSLTREQIYSQLIPNQVKPRQFIPPFLRKSGSQKLCELGLKRKFLAGNLYCHLLCENVPWARAKASVKARGKHRLQKVPANFPSLLSDPVGKWFLDVYYTTWSHSKVCNRATGPPCQCHLLHVWKEHLLFFNGDQTQVSCVKVLFVLPSHHYHPLQVLHLHTRVYLSHLGETQCGTDTLSLCGSVGLLHALA